MKIKMMAVLVFFVFLCRLSADEYMTIEMENVRIDVPAGWFAQYTKSPQLFFLYSPVEADDTFQENGNLVMEILPAGYSVERYMNESLESIKMIYTDFVLEKMEENYYIISGAVGDIGVKQLQLFYIRDNSAYILTFSAMPESFDRYYEAFREIAASFRY